MSGALEGLLARLDASRVRLWVEDGKLRYRAHAGALTPELAAELKARKPELLTLLGPAPGGLIERAPDQPDHELSPAQRNLWLISQLDEGSEAYHLPIHLLLEGPLDRGALERAIARVVERHESLRTTFVFRDGAPRQKIHDPSLVRPRWVDLRGRPDPRAAALALAREETLARFDLEAGPLLRVTLAAIDERRHALLLTMHHIVSDGWSLSVLLREISALYAASVRGAPDPLPPPAIQYRDYARWQGRALEGSRAASLRAHWTSRLAGKVQPLEIPTDRPRPPRRSFRGDMALVPLGARRSAALRALALAGQASLFMVLTALIKVLLFRYTRQTSVAVGTPVAGRARPELADQIGLYLNTLVLHDDLRPDMTFAELLASVRRTALQAYEHQDHPFDALVDDLRAARDLSRSPLVDVLVILQNAGKIALDLPGVQATSLFQEHGTSKVDLTFDFEEQGPPDQGAGEAPDGPDAGERGLLLGIRYATDLFDRARIDAMGEHLLALVDRVTAGDPSPIGALDLLGERERRRVVHEVNRTAAPFPEDVTIVELFERTAAELPGREAVAAADGRWTYGELRDQAHRIARSLRAAGVRSGDRVGLFLPRSIWLPAAMIGALTAGAVFVPLETTHPRARVAAMIRSSGARVVFTLGEPPAELASALDGVELVDVEAAARAASAAPDEPFAPVDPLQIAYIIYTSGSTGAPKGVVVAHRGFVNFIEAMRRSLRCAADEVALSVASPTFDPFCQDVFLPLTGGGRVVLAAQEDKTDGRRLAALIEAEGATMLQATPSTWKLLLEEGWAGREGLRMLCGGEPLTRSLAERLLARRGELWNLYGPTEITVWASLARVTDARATITVGAPRANTRMYVVDDRLAPAPVGVPGEIMIAGEGLAHGYWRSPRQTAAQFIPDPFGRGERVYRTGDLGRWLESGELECLGRVNDGQVKVRGFRIETGEIERCLLAHAQVEDAAVVAFEAAAGERELAAYVVMRAEVRAVELRAHIGKTLPSYMVPAVIERLERLPLNRNGKVDRGALRELARAAGAGRAEPATGPGDPGAPRDEAERRLLPLFRRALGVETVGVHDDFFDLGGHSLKAAALAGHVRRELDIDARLTDVFAATTVAALALRLRERAPGRLIPIRPAPDAPRYPASRAQRRLWVLCQDREASIAYNMSAPLLLRGELDREALTAALSRMIERHESLRTALTFEDGALWQRVRPDARFELGFVDLSGATSPDEEAAALVRREAGQPFDLATGPLLRAALLRLGERRHVLALCMHHIISDAWSLRVMAREITAHYRRAIGEAAPELPALRVQYRDYTAWQEELEAQGSLKAQQEYWLTKLAPPLPDCRLPSDAPRPQGSTFAGDRLYGAMSEREVAALRELGQRCGASLFAVLHAGVKCLLFRHTGQEDLLIGCTASGRSHPDLEGQIGFYVNLLALRDRIGPSDSFEAVVRRVSRTTTEGVERQDYPFDRLMEELQTTGDLRRAEPFEVVLDFGVAEDSEGSLPGLDVSVFQAQPPVAQFDIVLSFGLERGELRILAMYKRQLYPRARVERMIQHLCEILRAGAADPSGQVIHLPLSGAGAPAGAPVEDDNNDFNF